MISKIKRIFKIFFKTKIKFKKLEKKEYLKMRKIKVKNLDIGNLITMIKL